MKEIACWWHCWLAQQCLWGRTKFALLDKPATDRGILAKKPNLLASTTNDFKAGQKPPRPIARYGHIIVTGISLIILWSSIYVGITVLGAASLYGTVRLYDIITHHWREKIRMAALGICADQKSEPRPATIPPLTEAPPKLASGLPRIKGIPKDQLTRLSRRNEFPAKTTFFQSVVAFVVIEIATYILMGNVELVIVTVISLSFPGTTRAEALMVYIPVVFFVLFWAALGILMVVLNIPRMSTAIVFTLMFLTILLPILLGFGFVLQTVSY